MSAQKRIGRGDEIDGSPAPKRLRTELTELTTDKPTDEPQQKNAKAVENTNSPLGECLARGGSRWLLDGFDAAAAARPRRLHEDL